MTAAVGDALVALCVAVPLLGATLLLLTLGRVPRLVVDVFATAVVVGVIAISVVLLRASMDGRVVTWAGGWRPVHGVSVGIALVADPVGAGLVVLSSVLVLAAFVFSWRYFEEVEAYFHALMLAFLAGLNGFMLSGDLFNMFVFFELVGAVGFALTGYRTEEPETVHAALIFAIINSLGAYVTLLGIGLVYGRTGELGLAQIREHLSDPGRARYLGAVFALVCVGWLVKASAVPFHFWSAGAHAVAPTPVCILFSGVMSQMGVYAVARVYWTTFHGFVPADSVRRALLVLAVATVVVGAVMCYLQRHLKRLLAYSTISHMGMLLLGVALLEPEALAGVALFLLGEAAVAGALFIATGVLLNRYVTMDERDLHGRGRGLPLTAGVFVVGGAALAGAPPFSMALGKSTIEEAAASAGMHWVTVLLVAASVLTGGAVLRVALRVFWGAGPAEAGRDDTRAPAEDEQEHIHPETGRRRLTRVPWRMTVPAVALLGGAIALGVLPAMPHAVGAAAATFTDHQGYVQATLAGRDLTPPEPVHVSGWSVHSVVVATASLALAAGVAALTVWHRRLPRVLHPLGRVLWSGPALLRTLHTGHVGDYVAWLVVGVSVFGALVLLP